MKRVSLFLLLFLLILGFAGCENKTPEKEQNAISTAVTTTVTATTPKAEIKPAEKTEVLQKQKSEEEYIGNKNTHKFHRTSCGALPEEKNRVYLNSREEAIDKHYKACKKCNP